MDPRALLLLDAVQAQDGGTSSSARIFIYQRNVERLAGSVEVLESEIKAALEREIMATFVEPDRNGNPDSLN